MTAGPQIDLLGPARSVIGIRPAGYALNLGAEAVDVPGSEQLWKEGRETLRADAAERLSRLTAESL